jgi:hypothetical protein
MMRKIASVVMLWAAALVAGCGGGSGGSNDAFRPGAPAGSAPNATVASVTATSNRVSILSDGSESATITAFVRDSGNALINGAVVTFGASSGGISPASVTTGVDGTASATLITAGDRTLRTITVTATAGGISNTVAVPVVAAQPPIAVGSMTLSTSTPTIPSDGSNPATITAIVQDTSNRFLANVPVVFTTSSGGLAIAQASTNASGAATATLSTASDPTNRTITVTAVAGGITRTVVVNVVGSRLAIQGPAALVLGANAAYTVSLVDSADRGISGRALAVTSARGNTLSAPSLTTDSTGRATVNVTIANAGNDTLTVTGLGLTTTQPISVNSDSFTFTTPADAAEIPLATPTTVSVRWLTNGAPVLAGTPVTFTTTRGTITGSPALTNSSGIATVTIDSTSAGAASITAAGGGATAQRSVEFVASTAASIDAQSSTSSLGITEQATITAVVRDAAGNLVKNKTVTFTLTDVTGGTISLASAVTNSQGRAQTVYTAGTTVSARDGVLIRASVAGAGGTPITDDVNLTVARKEVFISLGTGNLLETPNPAQYKITFVIQLTDANGNGVPNVPVATSVLTDRYLKGFRVYLNGTWANYGAPFDICQDEDTLVPATARNGELNPGEDFNNNGRLDVGNIALVTPSLATTNAEGVVLVDVLFPRDSAFWVDVTLEARAAVAGTEFRRSTSFRLPGLSSDFNSQSVAPPGPISPFGRNACGVPN